MPKKETASEHIKTTLRRHPDFGGRDWKCRPKKGIEGTDAKIVRQSFNNSATGQDVEVLEISGHAHVEQRDGKLFVLTEVTPKAPSPALKPFTTVIDDDPENNAAADQAVQMILDGTTRDQEDEFDRLLDESGPIAWNNRICFAFCTQYGYDTWIIAPISFFEEHGHCPEGDVPAFTQILSDGGNGMFTALDQNTSPQKIAHELMAEGFVFSKDFQNFIDSEHNDLVPTRKNSKPNGPAP